MVRVIHRDVNLMFAGVCFRVRCGAPQVRSLIKIRVNLYRRPPLSPIRIMQRHIFDARDQSPILPTVRTLDIRRRWPIEVRDPSCQRWYLIPISATENAKQSVHWWYFCSEGMYVPALNIGAIVGTGLFRNLQHRLISLVPRSFTGTMAGSRHLLDWRFRDTRTLYRNNVLYR